LRYALVVIGMKERLMETQRSFQFVLVTTALIVAAATTSLPVSATEGTIADGCVVTGTHGGIYPQRVNRAVSPADVLINDLRRAEVQLNNGAVARARSILTSSRDYIRNLQFMKVETGRALQYINRSGESSDNGAGISPREWVGIYSSLDEMEVYAPEVAEDARKRLKQAQMHATTGDIHRTAETLKAVDTEVPYSLQPGQPIDRQIVLALELLGENQPDIATARSVVENVLNRLIVVDETTAASARNTSGVAA
jgi:hypothetical protein